MSQNHPFYFSAGSGHVPVTQARSDHAQSIAPIPPQQVTFQQAPQPPIMDMSVLEGISPEQLAAIARMFQSGALQMPPPVPPVPTQPPNPHQPALAVTESSSILSTLQSQPPPKVIENGMDTEEGEVNESESDNTPASSRDFLRPPPTGPKNRSVSPREIKQSKSSPRPPLQPAAASNQFQVHKSPSSQTTAVANGGRAAAKNEAAKAFVLEMYKAGYAYDDILPEVRNPKSLTRMFKELNLPIDSAYDNQHLINPNATTASNSQPQAPVVTAISHEDARKASLVKPQAPIKTAPKDRKTYLAELQAAKNKKTDTDVKTERSDYLARLEAARTKKMEPPVIRPTENQASSQNGQTPMISASGLVAPQPESADSKADVKAIDQSHLSSKAAKNELLKQKLQALKAQQAAKKARKAASSPAPLPTITTSTLQVNARSHGDGLGAGIADIPSHVAQKQAPPSLQTSQRDIQVPATGEPISSPIPETPSRSFSNLPGLFMFGSSSQQYATSRTLPSMPVVHSPAQAFQASNDTQLNDLDQSDQKPQAIAVPASISSQRKRPVASDFDDVSYRPHAMKRLFGQSRNASEDESLVIEVSDAEDEDDDIYPEPEPVPGQYSKTGLQTKSFRDVAPLRDFPPKQTFQTSSPGTPGGITYEQKMKEIEEFKRKIAEKEKRQKTNGKVPAHGDLTTPATHLEEANGSAAIDQSSPHLESNLPAYEPSGPDPIVQTVPEASAAVRSRSISAEQPSSPVQLFKQQEKERLRQRLLELEHEESADEEEDGEDDEEEGEVDELDKITPEPKPEPIMSGALPSTSESPSAHLQEQAMELESDSSQNGEPHARASDDGELDDDSVSNFYDVQETQPVQLQEESMIPDDTNEYTELTPPSTMSDTEAVAAPGVRVDAFSSPPAAISNAVEPQFAEVQKDDIPPEFETEVHLANGENIADVEGIDLSNVPAEPSRTIVGDLVSDSSPPGDTLEDGELDEDLSSYPEQAADPMQTGFEGDQSISNPGSIETRNVVMADDDLAPEIQPALEEESTISNVPPESMHHFTPYRSPLQGFKDYRYHPEYLNEVAGGHRSATYSYNIDPQQSFCPYETAGGTCNDAACPFQHFKSLFVSDTELLKMMGTKHIPANTPDEFKRWNEGLGQVVRELRNTNLGKDANAIAARIAQFRRDFVGDPTKILNFG